MGSEAPEPKLVLLVINWLLMLSSVDEIILPPVKQILPFVPYIDIDSGSPGNREVPKDKVPKAPLLNLKDVILTFRK